MSVYFLSYRARPAALEHVGPTGAYINCWVKQKSAAAAQQQAETTIRNNSWVVEAVEEAAEVVEVPSAESAQYFEQAQIDGEVYVFHTWSGAEGEHVH